MKKRLTCLLCALMICTMSGCGKEDENFVILPSGSNETQAPTIYLPNGIMGEVAPADVESAGTTNSATENVVKDEGYSERYANFYERISQPNLYTKFTLVKTSVADKATTKETIELAYLDDLSYVMKVDEKGSSTTVISNADASYLVNDVEKAIKQAKVGTFQYATRDSFKVGFKVGEGSYIGTKPTELTGMTLKADAYVYGDYTVVCGYDEADELILLSLEDTAGNTASYIFESITICDTKDYFKLSSSYELSEYQG